MGNICQEVIVETINLSKKYNNKYALKDVNLSIKKGDIFGFVGKNGAGKTTLIRLLCGIIFPTSGSYSLFNEKDPNKILQLRSKTAAMVETPSLYMNMTAEDNLKARCILMKKDFSIIESRLKEVGLEEVIGSNKKVKDFSLGMRQRLGIAVSMLGDPELLILDEPANGLDPKGIKEIRDLLVELNEKKGVTIIISSHILSELSKFVTTYGFIDKGRIVKQISAEELEKTSKKSLTLVFETEADYESSLILLKDYPNVQCDEHKIEKTLIIYGLDEVCPVLKMLFTSGINISHLKEKENGLEDFYMSLLKEE